MARVMSPRASPGLGPRTHGRSPSPASQQPQNKKERKRIQLAERMAAINSTFEQNHTDHYWAQLSAAQCEINLLMRADPYRDGPLDDTPSGIARQMADARNEICSQRPIAPEAEPSFQHASGKFYPEFVREINSALEQRDADLTSIYDNYQNSLTDIRKQTQYAIQLARSEHELLLTSLRDRIIQSAMTARTRLLKEKEQLDIADSNALLLNPSQFSIGNPISPGGPLNPRKTRNTRLRPGEGDEPSSLLAKAEESKRKRKAAFENDENGSPGPSSRNNASANEGSTATMNAPYKDAKRKLEQAQFEAPLYSIERLYSEKELAHNLDRAHLMTAEYFARLKAQGLDGNRLQNLAMQHQQNEAPSGGRDIEGNGVTEDGSNGNAEKEKQEGEIGADEEQSSQQQARVNTHATRSTQRAAAAAANPLNALSDIATSTLPSTLATTGLPFGSNAPASLPPYSLHTTAAMQKSNASAPPPPSATDAEVTHDLLMMKRGMQDPNYDEMLKRSVDRPGLGTGLAVAQAQADGQSSTFNMLRDESTSGVDMARGASAIGGVTMSRGPSLSGYGTEMRRTASQRGRILGASAANKFVLTSSNVGKRLDSMLFHALIALTFVPLILTSPLGKRQTTDDAAQVLADIGTVVNDISTLNSTLNRFPPLDPLGLVVALQVQSQTKRLGQDLEATTSDVQSSAPFTSNESTDIANAVLNLQLQIASLLTNIVAHKPSFATAVLFVGDLSKTVEENLQTQQQESAAFATALEAKLAEPFASAAPLIAGQIDRAFENATAKYQQCAGILCLPSLADFKE
ncbi:MAG: hypothetical protein Q9159_003140 [Coniocarpon cinnabarinum]